MSGVVAVLDADVLIPRGLRDLFLSLASVGVFRPVWQRELEREIRRNCIRIDVRRGEDEAVAATQADHVLRQMNIAFEDAKLDESLWLHRVPDMTNQAKDRHVLAAAVGSGASHLVSVNTKD